MRRILIVLSIFAVLVNILSQPVFSYEKMRIALMELQGKGVSKIVSYAVSDIIRSEMVKKTCSLFLRDPKWERY